MGEVRDQYEGNLHRRFVLRVLTPPFIALLILGILGLWQLDRVLKNQAIDNLQRSTQTGAATLEREFTLRSVVLTRTGSELFVIKNDYQASRKKLDENRDACQQYIRSKRTFQNSPGGVCEPFLAGFAKTGSSGLLTALEDEYVKAGEAIIESQNQRINERLSAFKQFFPETLALVIMDNNKQVVSSALSGVFKGSIAAFQTDAETALTRPLSGKVVSTEGFRLGVFAFPIAGGSVLAAYDIDNSQFIRQTWERVPIDRLRTLAVFLDANNTLVYPQLKDSKAFQNSGASLRSRPSNKITLEGTEYTAAGAVVGGSDWLMVVASPTAIVLAPLRDAQLAGVIAIALFMVGFTWVGSFFIQRTLKNIVSLVSGALVFGSGRLDYKISLDHADSEFVRLGETMNAMAERIARAEHELDEKNKEFISVATHEIRAPLSAIIGYLSMLQETYASNLDKQANTLVNQAYYGTVRLRDLVNDMLNVARLESGRAESVLTELDIKPVIQSVVDTMGVVAQISTVSLNYIDTDANYVLADEGRLRIIINNFVSNAIKYNRPGGKVTISHSVQNGQLVTVIADTGLGIPEDQKAHMFEKFFRVDHQDRKAITGTGLGMYVVKKYIEQMQGKLWFESLHGEGTKFYFSLPIAKVKLKTQIKTRLKKLVKHVSRQPKKLKKTTTK